MTPKVFSAIFQAKDEMTKVFEKASERIVTEFKKVTGEAKQFNKGLKDVKGGINELAGLAAFDKIAGGIQLVATAFADLYTQGIRLKALKQQFDGLSQGAISLEAVKSASQGAISEFVAMENANKGLLLGLPITTERMKQMADISIVLGQAMGIDASTALSDLTTGLGRGSAQILDNLGIIIDANEAYEMYALKIGKVTDELTNTEKKEAVFESAINAALIKINELNLSGNEAALGLQAMQSAVLDFVGASSSFLVALTQSDGFLSSIVEKLNDATMGLKFMTAGLEGDMDEIIRLYRVVASQAKDTGEAARKHKEELEAQVAAIKAQIEELKKRKQVIQETNQLKLIVRPQDPLPMPLGAAEAGGGLLNGPQGGPMGQYALQMPMADKLAASIQKVAEQYGYTATQAEMATEALRAYGDGVVTVTEMENALSDAKERQIWAFMQSAVSIGSSLRTMVGEDTKAAKAIAAVQGAFELAMGFKSYPDPVGMASHFAASAQFFRVAGQSSGGGGAKAGVGGGAGAQTFNPLQAPSNTRQQPTIVLHTTWDQNGFNTTVDGRAVNAVSQDINKGGQVMRTFQTAAGRF